MAGSQHNSDANHAITSAYNPSTERLKVEGSFSSSAPTTVYNGSKNVTTAGTRVALAASQAISSVTVKAKAANTGSIYVGDSTVSSSNGFVLAAGEAISMDIDNLADIYLDSSVNGEGVTYVAVG